MPLIYNRLRKGKAKMALGRGQYYCINQCEEMFSIQLSFLLHGKDHSSQQRLELFQYIQSKIDQLMQDFMTASTLPNVYLPCYYQECNELHVELQLLCDGEDQHCPTVEKPIPDDYYRDLFPNQGLYCYYHCCSKLILMLLHFYMIGLVGAVQPVILEGKA